MRFWQNESHHLFSVNESGIIMKHILATTVAVLSLALAGCMSTQSDLTGYGADAMGRTIPERISDSSIEITARRNLATVPGVNENNVRVAIDSYRREVLLTGEVPSEEIKTEIARTIDSMKDVEKVYNYLTVTDTPKSQSHTVHENYLRAKINARLLTNREIKSSQYQIVVRDRTAYVMGYITPQQQDYILQAIQDTPGMAMAVTLTTIVSDGVSTDIAASTSSDTYGGVVTLEDTEAAALQSISTPNATTEAPSNSMPVFDNAQ